MTRSLSSPKSVERSHTAPSRSKITPRSRNRSMARATAPDSCKDCSWKNTSKSERNSCSEALISSNISSTPRERKTSRAWAWGSARGSGSPA